ncbi:DinB family protein [Halpernia frigidisoli]|uniref:Uncharacterized damage-inducible protein DinB (Forms a four-helix bundle) n=1 Tax=Halpernia frigidisoli TaxID=1125876 RepID=A0A1I3CXI7_9FLAO|nr:DinB family protein [Halpernia frigidisoli]SFH79234.1 Uncharacterized damage-inducible protein DinB (forms a four-helix bundle) [Halpernia frigidisoli]
MREFFEDLLNYNFYYNEKLIEFLDKNDNQISEKAKLLLTHLINAQNIWNHRILHSTTIFGVWETLPLEKLQETNLKNLETSNKILENEDFERLINYENSNGEKFENVLKDIMFHYLNHSTYHRAQIATEIKNSGLEPINSDFIAYKR